MVCRYFVLCAPFLGGGRIACEKLLFTRCIDPEIHRTVEGSPMVAYLFTDHRIKIGTYCLRNFRAPPSDLPSDGIACEDDTDMSVCTFSLGGVTIHDWNAQESPGLPNTVWFFLHWFCKEMSLTVTPDGTVHTRRCFVLTSSQSWFSWILVVNWMLMNAVTVILFCNSDCRADTFRVQWISNSLAQKQETMYNTCLNVPESKKLQANSKS